MDAILIQMIIIVLANYFWARGLPWAVADIPSVI